jgi:hypothetical protein
MSISDYSVTENNHLFLQRCHNVKNLDPANKEEHHIVLHGKRKIVGAEDVVKEEYNQFDALPSFNKDITIPTIDDTEEPMYIRHDQDEAIIVR